MQDLNNYEIQKLLETRREIAVIWGIDDVKMTRPDLSDDQCWEVLKTAEDQHNGNIGLSWPAFEEVAENLFGPCP